MDRIKIYRTIVSSYRNQSCSADGVISLNFKFVHFSLNVKAILLASSSYYKAQKLNFQ